MKYPLNGSQYHFLTKFNYFKFNQSMKDFMVPKSKRNVVPLLPLDSILYPHLWFGMPEVGEKLWRESQSISQSLQCMMELDQLKNYHFFRMDDVFTGKLYVRDSLTNL